MNIQDQPAVKRFLARAESKPGVPPVLDANWVKQVVLEAGADDAGLASIDSPRLEPYRKKICRLFPQTKTIVSVVCRMNPLNIRSSYRQQYELEYHHMFAEADHVARRAARSFWKAGLEAMDVCASYPMNMEHWPDEGMWWVAHKPVAEAAGMGIMGLNRLLAHPRFGASISLASILLDHPATEYGEPVTYDPCVHCMLCVIACPVGAIHADGHFTSIACCTHSYRAKYGGFTSFIENVVKARSVLDFRRRVTDQEAVLMWQALAMGTSYQCTNCMAVCPSGDERLGEYVEDAKAYRTAVAERLMARKETIYVVRGSDADEYVRKKFPHKRLKYVSNGVRPGSCQAFLDNIHIMFQREQSKGLSATYHFTFTGEEQVQGTVRIHDRRIESLPGHQGTPDVRVTADARTWLSIVRKERSTLIPMLTGRLKIEGSRALMKAFQRCFPA